MKPIDRRKFFAALHTVGRTKGVTFVEEADAGSGSHGSLYFSDGSGCRPLRLVITYSREISPGVQRAILANVSRLSLMPTCHAAERELATTVLAVLRECVAV